MPFAKAPKVRSPLHLALGALWFRARRWGWWLLGGVRFARPGRVAACPFLCASHATPLFRPLKDLDRWLQENKVVNLRLAVRRLDGVVVLAR